MKSVLCILISILIANSISKAERSCVTSRGQRGKCVRAKECGEVKRLIEKYGLSDRYWPQEIWLDLQSSICFRGRFSYKVCCADHEHETNEYNNRVTVKPTPLPATNKTTHSPHDRQLKISAGYRVLYDVGMSCGPSLSPRIVNGKEVRLKQYPWMALLKYDAPNPFQCGGSLITERYVLTAAHCFVNKVAIGVRLGEHDLSNDEDCVFKNKKKVCIKAVDFGIAEWKLHERFNYSNRQNDIALIRLDRNIDFKRYAHVRPICLPITNSAIKADKTLDSYIVAGWGKTEYKTSSNQLLHTLVGKQELNVCRDYTNIDLGEQHKCAGGNGTSDTCHGDSGGPLFNVAQYQLNRYRYIQFGITSFGVAKCGVGFETPSVYTNVMFFLNWIAENIY